jgi:hypothetical protein
MSSIIVLVIVLEFIVSIHGKTNLTNTQNKQFISRPVKV